MRIVMQATLVMCVMLGAGCLSDGVRRAYAGARLDRVGVVRKF